MHIAHGARHTMRHTTPPHGGKWRFLLTKIFTQSHVNFRMNHPQKHKSTNKSQQKTHTKRMAPPMIALKLCMKSLNFTQQQTLTSTERQLA